MLVAAHATQLEIAQGDTRKGTRLVPKPRIHQVTQRVYTEDEGLAIQVP